MASTGEPGGCCIVWVPGGIVMVAIVQDRKIELNAPYRNLGDKKIVTRMLHQL